MITTLGKFADVFGPLIPMREHQEAIGRKLFAGGVPYSQCRTDAERDGYVAAQSAAMDARQVQPELVAA